MWSAILSILLGAAGWGITHLLFEPMKEIMDLRRETQECLIVHGNLSKDAPADERRAASDTFRRIGAGLVARHIAALPWVRRCCTNWFGWDIHSAGAMLISSGNSIQFEGTILRAESPTVTLIRSCLRLPTPETPPMVQALWDHAGAPAPIGPGDQI
jgi:hypothetical protein